MTLFNHRIYSLLGAPSIRQIKSIMSCRRNAGKRDASGEPNDDYDNGEDSNNGAFVAQKERDLIAIAIVSRLLPKVDTTSNNFQGRSELSPSRRDNF